MKKLFILVLLLAILASCTETLMVTPIGSNIRVKASNTEFLPLMSGDTVILAKALTGYQAGEYIILNDFILRESWIKYDSNRQYYYGREYFKAVVY